MPVQPDCPDDEGMFPADAGTKLASRPGVTTAGKKPDLQIAGLPDGIAPRFSRFKMRQLALVLKLTETGNLHDAAEALHMSQPAATKLLSVSSFMPAASSSATPSAS